MSRSVNLRAIIRGNTFPFRDDLRQMGAQWDAQNKQWVYAGGSSSGPYRKAKATLARLGDYPGIEVEILEDLGA